VVQRVLLILAFAVFVVHPRAESEYDLEPQRGSRQLRRQHPRYAQSATPQKLTKTLQGILFDSDYDNGSLLDIQETGTDQFAADLYTDSGELGTARYWLRFRMTGVAGRSIRIAISHGRNPRPVIRMGDGPWRRMTADEAPDLNTLALSFGADTDIAEVAFFFPMGYAETLRAVGDIVRRTDSATTFVIGKSSQGRDLWMVRVTDSTVSDVGKHRVWIHARAHAGESTASYAMLGFLLQITDDSYLGHWLRHYCIFTVVPILNCDGTYLGHTRWDSRGIDPEREWDTPDRTPEVASLHSLVNQFMAGPNPIEVSLNLHSTQGNYTDTFFFKHLYPSVSHEFEAIQQRYIEAFRNSTPLFDNRSPQTSQLDDDQFIESYYWNHWRENVMAMTYEGHFLRRITDNEYITDEDYMELGRGLAIAVIEYFDLPILPPSERWGWVLY